MWGEGPQDFVSARSKECCRTSHGARRSIPQTSPALCLGLQQPKPAKPVQSQLGAPRTPPQPCPASQAGPGDPQHGLCSVGLVLATALWLRQPLASSTVQELCDTLSSMPEILDKVLTEFATLLRNQWCNPRRAVSYQEGPDPLL